MKKYSKFNLELKLPNTFLPIIKDLIFEIVPESNYGNVLYKREIIKKEIIESPKISNLLLLFSILFFAETCKKHNFSNFKLLKVY